MATPTPARRSTYRQLQAQQTRDRKDGYIYSYIRHGGVVMPSYGAQVTSQEAWELIAYIRHMQQTVVHADTPQIRGMVFKVRHLVKVEEK